MLFKVLSIGFGLARDYQKEMSFSTIKAMTLESLKQQRVGVIGVGINNLVLIDWLIRHGVDEITICDQNPAVRLEHPDWEGKVTWRLGPDYLEQLADFGLVFRTPGVPYLSPKIQQALAAGVEISSQTKLFFELCPAKVIGVTGTKGKGTTATLITRLLQQQVRDDKTTAKIYLAGNIGQDPFIFVDDLRPDDWVVLELSSFQLQDLNKSPHIGVVLNITVDHLDHHKNRDEYVEAKTSIVRHQQPTDFAVINFDSETAMAVGNLSLGQDWYFSRKSEVDRGAFVRWDPAKAGQPKTGTVLLRDGIGHDTGIIEIDRIPLRGEHNLDNVTAAVTAAHVAGVGVGAMATVLAKFQGLEHRLELVADKNGIQCFNDSFATNPEPVMAAVTSFHEPVHLIVGGRTKGADFTELGKAIVRSSVKTVIPLGEEESLRIVAAIEAARTSEQPAILPVAKTMDEAVDVAVRQAKRGEVVLLSPGATSFDLFPNYKVRGKMFAQAAHRALGIATIGGAKHGA